MLGQKWPEIGCIEAKRSLNCVLGQRSPKLICVGAEEL